MSFLIIDMKRGGMDGFYAFQADAERIAEWWKLELCHDQVIVVDAGSEPGISMDSYCFLADRRMRGALHGPSVRMDSHPPKEHWKQCAIMQCTELLRDLYEPNCRENFVARIQKLLATVDSSR